MQGALPVIVLFYAIMAIIYFPKMKTKTLSAKIFYASVFALSFGTLAFRSFGTKIVDPIMKLTDLWPFLFSTP